jgi:intein/homing endonuclease
MARKGKGIPKKGTPQANFTAPQSLTGVKKEASLLKEGEYQVTQTNSFFYSPELTSESWLLPKSRQEILKWPILEDQEILCNGVYKKISDVKIGDLVLSRKGIWQKVLDIQRKKADSSAVKLTIKYCPPVEMASYHPVLGIQAKGQHRTLRDAIRFGFVTPKEKLTWIDANLLQEGDLVACPKIKFSSTEAPKIDLYVPTLKERSIYKLHKGRVKIVTPSENSLEVVSRDVAYSMPRFLPLTNKVLEFLGWYIAEGHVADSEGHKNAITLTLSHDEENIAKALKETLITEFHIPEHKIHIGPHNGSIRLFVNSSVLAEFVVQYFNTGSNIKDIPMWLFELENNLVLSFLRGWVRGDGTVKNITPSRPAMSVCTVSQSLAYKGHLLFNQVGVPVWFRQREQDLAYINKKSKIQMKSVAPFAYTLGISGENVNKIYPGSYSNENTEVMYFEDDQYFYFPVTGVEVFDTDKDFCCVTTEDHTINVPFTTHNCRIFYNLEPYVKRITNLHAAYPFSKFDLVVQDVSVKKFYEEMCSNQHFNLLSYILRASISYNKFGEAICFGNMTQDVENPKGEEKLYRWANFVLLEPELVEIKTDMLTGTQTFELIPTEELKALVSSTRPEDQERVEKLKESSPELVNAINDHRNIKLDENCTSMIADLTDPSATRGTSPIQCLTGDTKIRLLDGTSPTLKELFDLKRKNFWVYSIDKNNSIVPGRADEVVFTKKDIVYKITLDSGNYIKCSKEHPIVLRDGSYKNAEFLSVGESLMPLYSKISKLGEESRTITGYELIYNPADDAWKYTHRVVADFINGAVSKKDIVHHQNFHKTDNTPENLLVLSRKDHIKLHKALVEKARQNPDFIKNLTAGVIRSWEKEERHEIQSERLKELWETEEYRNNAVTAMRISKADPEYRKKTSETQKIVQQRPEVKAKIAQTKNENGSFLVQGESMKRRWQDPEYVAKILAIRRSPEFRKNAAEKQKQVAEKKRLNHKVLSIEILPAEELYDIKSVGNFHNFALDCGVFVHNCLFKALILQDWIRLAQSAYAQNYVFPKELWTIGDLASNTMPSEQDISNWKNLINQSIQNPPFSIFAPPIVKYEPLSVMGKQFPLNAEYDYIQDQLLVGMGVNKNVILGEGPNFGNSKTMALHALVMQYKTVRDKFEDWMINHFFRPIAEKNNFYTVDPATGKKELILPQISWYKSLDIEDEDAEKDRMMDLHDKGLISTKTLFAKFPELDFETERQNLEQERGTIFDKGGGKDRIPAKISKPSGGGEVGAGGGGMGGEMPEPVEPIEPIEPGEEGAEGVGEEVPGEVGATPEMVEAPEGGAVELAAPER